MEENPYEPAKSALSRGPGLGRLGAMSIASIGLNGLISALLVYAAFHVDVDRTNRRPVVTWTGPAAAWAPHLGNVVGGLVMTAFALSSPAILRDGRVYPLGVLAFFLTFLNMFGGCL